MTWTTAHVCDRCGMQLTREVDRDEHDLRHEVEDSVNAAIHARPRKPIDQTVLDRTRPPRSRR